jgi:DNA-directed RNA polymerase specialized sigma24 family protein
MIAGKTAPLYQQKLPGSSGGGDLSEQAGFADTSLAPNQGHPPLTSKPPLLPDGAAEEMRRWLFHAASCRAISLLRRRRLIRWVSLTTLALEAEPMSTDLPFEDQLVESAAMQAALAKLAPKEKVCLLLQVVQGFTAAEVPQMLGESPQAIAKRLVRAKKRLQAVYLAQEDRNG